ncbi:hypothetical protein JZ751_020574 [Albula glossodonta]|uniref:Uncharacterized protein n=1 Tax=Albula glossodonta TaxID=121402 RepID=A0A8T2PLD6_9TELE|nr:hypothetical protein JZ751_020574 [Albula glossodonta]
MSREIKNKFEGSSQVLSHRLGADVDGETGQLRGVLELSVECSQVHGKEVVLGKRGLLEQDLPEVVRDDFMV